MNEQSDPEILTTGRAAKLLAVTPDTVRRWVKRGRLQATRTSGGHHRILLRDIAPLIPARYTSDTSVQSSECASAPMYCWEYLSPHGEVRDECVRCIVYRSRATWCFRLAEFSDESGHSRVFCHMSCEECAYYRRVKHLATKALVITADQGLVSRLEDDPRDTLSIHFASDTYEASAAIGEYRPGIVVLDWGLDQVGSSELLERLAFDNRVPGLRIIIAVSNSWLRPKVVERMSDVVIGILEKPFDARCIEALIDRLPVEVLPTSEVEDELPDGNGGPDASVAANTIGSGGERR